MALGLPSWWREWAYDRHYIYLEAQQVRGTLWYDLVQDSGRERGCCPGRHSLKFTIYRLWGGYRKRPHSYDGLPRRRWHNENMSCKLDDILPFKSNSSPRECISPGITIQIFSVSSVLSYPYPELLQVLYASATNTRGAGIAFLNLPGTSGSSVCPCHNTRKFWKL